MKTENRILMQQARETLADKWGLAVGTAFVYIICVSVVQSIPGLGALLGLIIGGPMALGLATFVLSMSRNQGARLEQIFDGFKNFSLTLVAYLLIVLFVLLWGLLLIVPGIIAAISYSMTFFIIADNKQISAMEAIEQSKKMMMGYKWKYFTLQLRFLGWAILCVLTLGIGFLWLMPYMKMADAKFYEDIKGIVPPTPAPAPVQ